MRAESHGSSDKGKSLSLGWVRHRVFKLAQGLEVETSQILAQQIGYFSYNIGSLGNVVGKAGLNASVKSLASEWQWGDQEISRAEKGWELHPTKSPWSFTLNGLERREYRCRKSPKLEPDVIAPCCMVWPRHLEINFWVNIFNKHIYLAIFFQSFAMVSIYEGLDVLQSFGKQFNIWILRIKNILFLSVVIVT